MKGATGPDDRAAPDWLKWALAQPAQSHQIGAPGQRLHYRSWPEPTAASGRGGTAPGILLVHGYAAHSHWWDACAPYLARDFRVVAMDLAGMGDSEHRTHYTQRQYADDIAAVITAADIGPAIVIGHSFGGIMTTWAAHYHPSLVRTAVILDSRLNFAGDRPGDELVERRVRAPYQDYETAYARFRLVPEQHCADPMLFDHVAKHSLRQVEGGWEWKFDDHIIHSLPWPDPTEAELLPALKPKVALLYGESSLVVPPEFAWRMSRCLKHPEAPIMIPAAHHHVLLDQPLALVAALRAVLSEFITPRPG